MKKANTQSSPQLAIQAYNAQDYVKAASLFQDCIANGVAVPESTRNKGLCHYKLGQLEDAVSTLYKALPILPDDPMLLEGLGLSLTRKGSYTEALNPLVKRIVQDRSGSGACTEALIFCTKQGHLLTQAIKLVDELGQSNQLDFAKQVCKARLYSAHNNREAAIECLSKPEDNDSELDRLIALGEIEAMFHQFKSSERYYLEALTQAEPKEDLARCKKIMIALLNIHSHAGQETNVRQLSHNFLRAFPDDQNRLLCLNAFLEKSMLSDAQQLISEFTDPARYQKELTLAKARVARSKHDIPAATAETMALLQQNPNDPYMVCHLGLLLSDAGLLELAAAAYERALALNSTYHMAKWNLAITHFLLGNFKKAFELAESRWSLEHLIGKRPTIAPELAQGEQIVGKKVYVYYEQGLGDTLQFARFASCLALTGADVFLNVQPPLVKLLKNSLSNVHVLEPTEQPPTADRQIPLMSIPFFLGTDTNTIPYPTAYLKAVSINKKVWHSRLPKDNRPLVGLAWSGSFTHKNDHNRSLRVEQLAPLLGLPINYVAIQRDIPPTLKQSPPENLFLVEEYLQDFNDTAQLLDHVDLVITVDSSPAHLAAASGKEVWLLLPRPCDWRWMAKGDKTPWYKQMKIFRQQQDRRWDQPVNEVRNELIKRYQLQAPI